MKVNSLCWDRLAAFAKIDAGFPHLWMTHEVTHYLA